MQDEKCQNSFMEAMNPKESAFPTHRRSKSDLIKGGTGNKWDYSAKSFHLLKQDVAKVKVLSDNKVRRAPDTAVQISLEQEIHQLKKRLQDQFMLRYSLEKALGYKTSAGDASNDCSMPKATKELIREIAVLEFEVMHLEKYLLSLYRKAFNQQISTLSPTAAADSIGQSLRNLSGSIPEAARLDVSFKKGYPEVQSSRLMLPRMLVTGPVNEECTVDCQQKLQCRTVHRSHSSLPKRSVCSSRMPPLAKKLLKGLRPCHSQPFPFLENTASGVISLADYLGTSITDHVPETPSKISEDMVRCMGAIYCRLSEPPVVYHVLTSSPTSSFSSMSASSPRYLGDMWSPGCKRGSTLDARLENPFRVEGLKGFSGPYNTMVEVPWLSRDKRRINDVENLMKNYKSLVQRLETVDPLSMKYEEKLSFWINIHNALIMHTYLDYGIPQNYMKRSSLFSKAQYTIGGLIMNVDMIQSSILRCRTHRPEQWLRTLLSPSMKFKAGDEHAYAIENPEPLLHFALCSGSHSDPAVRIYTSKRVIHQLEAAKEEYIRATVGIRKEQKILLPKLIDSFAKETSLSLQGVADMIQRCLPETLQMIMQRCQQGRSHRIIEWVPYSFTFRYLLSRELAIHLTD